MLGQQAGVCSVQEAGDELQGPGAGAASSEEGRPWPQHRLPVLFSHGRERALLFLQGTNSTRGLCPHHPKSPHPSPVALG